MALDRLLLCLLWLYVPTLQVPVTSVTITPSTTVTIDVGTSTTLTCTTQPHSRPSANVTWYRVVSGQPQQITIKISVSHDTQNSTQTTTSVLSYVPSKEDNGRTVYCVSDGGWTGSTDKTLVSTKIALNVRFAPRIHALAVTDPFPWLARDDYLGRLSCVTTPGNPSITRYTWYRDGTPISSQTSQVISFNPPTSSDNGRLYKCRAENDFTDSRGSAPESNTETIHVEYAPSITLLACPETVNETDNYRCTCTAVGNPNPTVTWYPRDSSTNSILDLPSINRNKAGRYICNATSSSQKFGTLYTQSVLNLVVQYAPDVELLVQNATDLDTNLVMTCNASGVPNVYTYGVWTHMYGTTTIRTLSGDVTTQGRTLTLTSVSYQDSGTYICQVQNSIRGRDGQLIQTGTAVFDIRDVPDTPTDLVVNQITMSSAEVSWIPGINRGRENQTFHFWLLQQSSTTWDIKQIPEETYTLQITNLLPATTYTVLLFATNEKGKSENSTLQFTTTQQEIEFYRQMYMTSVSLICVSVFILLTTIGIGVFVTRFGHLPFMKRRNNNPKTSSKPFTSNIKVSEHAMARLSSCPERQLYEDLDTADLAAKNVYEQVNPANNAALTDNPESNYKNLKRGSGKRVYEELKEGKSDATSKQIYVNTALRNVE